MRRSRFVVLKVLGFWLIFLLSSTSLQAKQKAFCSAYAQSSVLAHIQNIKSECGFKGQLWSPGLRKHQTWCLDGNESTAKKNMLLHKQKLAKCGRTMQRELEWEEIDFIVQNELFGELIMAIAMDDIDSLKLFESEGIDLGFEWHLIDGGLLYWAISNQAPQVSRYLIENKSANPNLTSNGGPNPLVKLLSNSPEVNYRLLDYLLRKGAKPNHSGEGFSDDSLPLRVAAGNNDLIGVKILLKYRADPNLYVSIPPLMVAIYRNNSRMVDLLLNAGANPNRGLEGLSCSDIKKYKSTGELLAMDAALAGGNTRIIKVLSSARAKTTKQCHSPEKIK